MAELMVITIWVGGAFQWPGGFWRKIIWPGELGAAIAIWAMNTIATWDGDQ